jgi:pimeloyl-ACP methyl ester carboxylesterase
MTSSQHSSTPTGEPPARRLDRGEGRIAYDVIGSGPLVVCVPGMGELRSSYRHNTAALAAAGFRVATMDLRGHGDSDATFTAYDDPAAGSEVGNSMGAAAAVWAAAERPDLVTGLALLGPFVREVPINPLMAWAFRIAMSGPWAPAVWHAYLPSLSPGRRPADFAEHRAAVRASMRRPGYGKAFSATTRTSHAPVEARLTDVQAPALVVMGTADPDFPDATAEAQWIVAHLADAESLLIDGAGHYPQAEEPEQVNAALVAFAQGVQAGA